MEICTYIIWLYNVNTFFCSGYVYTSCIIETVQVVTKSSRLWSVSYSYVFMSIFDDVLHK